MRAAIDPAGIDDRAGRWLLARVARAGLRASLWEMGAGHGIAAIGCAIMEPGPAATLTLPPAFGAGCHPRRAVALTRAILEAAQTRIALIAGSRDDLADADYADPGEQRSRLAFATLDLGGPCPRDWRRVPDHVLSCSAAERGFVLAVCDRAGAGAVACVDLTPAGSPLAVVRIAIPGFGDHDRPPA